MEYTIEELERASDKELSVMVTMRLTNCDEWCLSADESCFYHCGIDGDGWFEIPVMDINSWADMGPIIVGCSISIDMNWIKGHHQAGVEPVFDGYVISYLDENPLRAAAIVYLLME